MTDILTSTSAIESTDFINVLTSGELIGSCRPIPLLFSDESSDEKMDTSSTGEEKKGTTHPHLCHTRT